MTLPASALQIDAFTVLVVLFVSSLLFAAGLKFASGGVLRGGMGRWIASLLVQALAWAVVMAASGKDVMTAAVVWALLACSWSLQAAALLAFHGRRTPAWLLYGTPAVAGFAALLEGEPAAVLLAPGGGWWLLAFHALTVVTTLAFVSLHKQRMRSLASIDHLTGLYNRRVFMRLAAGEIARARRAGRAVSLMMIDLDRFRNINDRHGRVAGDAALRAVARILRRCTRAGDLLARYGGEEFVALLPAASRSDADALAQRLRREVAQATLDADGHVLCLTVSIGVAVADADRVVSLKSLVDEAGRALHMAKSTGRNRVVSLGRGAASAAAAA